MLRDICVAKTCKVNYICEVCKKLCSSPQMLSVHESTCLRNKVAALEEQISSTGNTINIQNNIQNNIQTTNNQFNIFVFGQEDLTQLNYKNARDFLMDNPIEFIPNMLGVIHNNDKFPKYKNVLYDGKKLLKYDGSGWVELCPSDLSDRVKYDNTIRTGIQNTLDHNSNHLKYIKSIMAVDAFDATTENNKNKIYNAVGPYIKQQVVL